MMNYVKIAVVVGAFLAGWAVNGWRIGENIAESEAQRARDTIEIERLNAENANAVAARHAAEKAAQAVKTRTITKEVIKYVQSPDAGQCDLSDDWVRIHNDSTGVPTDTAAASGSDDTTGRTKTDVDALVTVTDNYAVCKANAARLEALQEWAKKVTDSE